MSDNFLLCQSIHSFGCLFVRALRRETRCPLQPKKKYINLPSTNKQVK
nr:MAG TPA: hypothetical protein [Caudoviricetes sp.]DAS26229.1 MAG TPA: hypothetical protein [Caudoviricetes sp.]